MNGDERILGYKSDSGTLRGREQVSKNIPLCEQEDIHSEVVEMIKKQMLPASEVSGLSSLFKILGDPTRIRIMWALEQSEMCVCDLSSALGMTKSAVSHQLNTLRQGKLVKYRREGKNVYYSLDDGHVNSIIEIAREHIRHN